MVNRQFHSACLFRCSTTLTSPIYTNIRPVVNLPTDIILLRSCYRWKLFNYSISASVKKAPFFFCNFVRPFKWCKYSMKNVKTCPHHRLLAIRFRKEAKDFRRGIHRRCNNVPRRVANDEECLDSEWLFRCEIIANSLL